MGAEWPQRRRTEPPSLHPQPLTLAAADICGRGLETKTFLVKFFTAEHGMRRMRSVRDPQCAEQLAYLVALFGMCFAYGSVSLSHLLLERSVRHPEDSIQRSAGDASGGQLRSRSYCSTDDVDQSQGRPGESLETRHTGLAGLKARGPASKAPWALRRRVECYDTLLYCRRARLSSISTARLWSQDAWRLLCGGSSDRNTLARGRRCQCKRAWATAWAARR